MLPLLSERYPNSQQLEDLAACRSHLRGGSRSFYAASHFLPQPMGHHACGLYAFCREADDVIDEGDDQWAALQSLKTRLDAIYSGAPHPIAADRAVAAVVAASVAAVVAAAVVAVVVVGVANCCCGCGCCGCC